MVTTPPLTILESFIVAAARQVLWNGIRPGDMQSVDNYDRAMEVVYDEHGMTRGSDQVCYGGPDCSACSTAAMWERL